MNLTEDDFLILFYLQKYSFLTIKQAIFSIGNRSYQNVARRLRMMLQDGLVSAFGGHKYGFRNIPKVYYLKEKGYNLLLEHDIPLDLLGRYTKKSKPRWTTKTDHRIHLIDVFLSLEKGVRTKAHLGLSKVFLEYKRVFSDNTIRFETTDYIGQTEESEHKIVPDGAFILHNIKRKNRALFFIEMDMGTERILSHISKRAHLALYHRIKKYDDYLLNGRYADKYGKWGKFDSFVLLFVTLSAKRMKNIRSKLFNLSEDLQEYYMFNTFDTVKNNFFNNEWKIRSTTDQKGYSLVD